MAQAAGGFGGALSGSALAVQAGSLPTSTAQIENLPLRVLPDGSTLRVGDVGQVRMTSDPGNSRLLYIGDEPAVEVSIERAITGDIIGSAIRLSTIKDRLRQKSLPPIFNHRMGQCRRFGGGAD